MKIPPVAYLALAAAAAGVFLAWKLSKTLPAAAAAAAQAVNPFNHDNAIATTVNDYGASIFTEPDAPGKNADGSWSLGGWAYDVFNPGQAQAIKDLSRGTSTGGATGSW